MACVGQRWEDQLLNHLQIKMKITADSIKHRSLQTFLEEAASKFDRGQAEHGGLLTDRDCFMEMRNEIIDQWHYWAAEMIRREKREQYIQELEAEVLRLRTICGAAMTGSMLEAQATTQQS